MSPLEGEYQTLAARDREYTRDVADKVKKTFTVDNVVQSTHVVARAMMDLFRKSKSEIRFDSLIANGE